MAEITSKESHKNQRRGVGRSKKLSTRVDLTPMVDLGFLLITFFIFTTVMSQPKAMKLVMPADSIIEMPIKKSAALTLLPAANETVYYYEGNFEESILQVTSLNGLRDIIIDKKRRTKPSNLFVIIKPSKVSVYGNIVKVLDEMIIDDIKSYALVDITEKEETLIK